MAARGQTIRDLVDTRSKEYARAFDMFNRGVVRLVDKMMKQGMSADQIVQALGATDFTALARSSKMQRALGEISNAYRDVLGSMVGRHAVSENMLTALQSFTRDSFLAKASALPKQIKAEAIKSVLGGGRTSDVAKALEKFTTRAHAQTEAATALMTYSRSVEFEMAKQDPPDTTYSYEGPVDDVTRDICLEMAAAGALTLAEIEDRFPGAFVDGGGFNCRHSWVPEDAAFQVDPDAAAERIAAREDAGDWQQPQTVREALDGA